MLKEPNSILHCIRELCKCDNEYSIQVFGCWKINCGVNCLLKKTILDSQLTAFLIVLQKNSFGQIL